MMTVATTVTKSSSPIATRKKYSAPHRPSIEELKKKYESNLEAAQGNLKPAAQLSTAKVIKKSKVKQMASMFNFKIAQIMRRESAGGKGFTLINELSPEAKPQPKACLPKPLPLPRIRYNKERAPIASPRTKSKAKAQQKSMHFLSEDNFAKLTVKDKAQLYTQFINDMSKKNPKFGKHAELLEANVEKEVARGEVINEKQESVKHLLEELEARCAFSKQTVFPTALQKINSVKKGATKPKPTASNSIKSKEFEDILEKKVSHISTLTVTLQPTIDTEVKKKRRSRSLPRQRRSHEDALKELGIIEPSHKRNNDEMRSFLPFEAYAPPKKIRRTRAERLAPQVFFQNQQLENLFFTWLRERQVEDQQKKTLNEKVKPNSTIEKLLEEAIVKLETVEIKQIEACIAEEKKIDIKAKKLENYSETTPKLTPRKKKSAPPVPLKLNKLSTNCYEVSNSSSAKQSECEESESGLSFLPKITSEESQEKESENSERDTEFAKPIKPLRKKKLRRTLAWKKDTFIEEVPPIVSTDSDTECKANKSKNKNKMWYVQPQTTDEFGTATVDSPPEPSFVETNKSITRDLNSPCKIKSAYTLSVVSPTHCQEDQSNKNLNTSECIKHGSDLRTDKMAKSSDLTVELTNSEPRSLADSFIDQGFETGSNDMDSPVRAPKRSNLKRLDAKVSGPLFLKLGLEYQPDNNAVENPSGFSTPIKGHLQQPAYSPNSSADQQQFSPIKMPLKNRRRSIYDAESRRNSLAMQVIREDHPLEHHEMTSPRNINNTEQVFFANASTLDMSSDLSATNTNKVSQFWIKSGDFSVFLDIYFTDMEKVRLLYEIFSQRSCDTKDLHFGIDDQKFSVHNPHDQEDITKLLPANKDCSYYWFSTGDFAIPFSGKHLSLIKIQRLYEFIKASVEETGILRFGVDAVEFSNVSEFWNQSPKFSMESNYSMLVGLQSGNSNGLEGRSKFAWPNTKPVRISDLDQSDYECEEFEDNDSSRLSFSPFGSNNFDLTALGSEELSMPRNSEAMTNSESFGYEYENESLDRLFDDKCNVKPLPAYEPSIKKTPVPEMLNTLKTQQERLSLVQEKLSTYNNPANLSSDALDALKGTTQYLNKLRNIVAEITSKGSINNFKDCTIQQLESYMFFLSRYTDICLHSCSDHMEKVLDALLDHRAEVV